MRPIAFVACLYLMGAACVLVAIGDQSWPWLIGSVVGFAVAEFARRKLKEERRSGTVRSAPRFSFMGVAMLSMVAAMFGGVLDRRRASNTWRRRCDALTPSPRERLMPR